MLDDCYSPAHKLMLLSVNFTLIITKIHVITHRLLRDNIYHELLLFLCDLIYIIMVFCGVAAWCYYPVLCPLLSW